LLTLPRSLLHPLPSYIEELQITSGAAQGLLRHIVNGTVVGGASTDNGAWLTGNGWAAAGLVKVIATIAQSEFATDMQDEINTMITWTQDILDGCYQYADPLIHNYFNDSSE
jgi:hypothetical protein